MKSHWSRVSRWSNMISVLMQRKIFNQRQAHRKGGLEHPSPVSSERTGQHLDCRLPACGNVSQEISAVFSHPACGPWKFMQQIMQLSQFYRWEIEAHVKKVFPGLWAGQRQRRAWTCSGRPYVPSNLSWWETGICGFVVSWARTEPRALETQLRDSLQWTSLGELGQEASGLCNELGTSLRESPHLCQWALLPPEESQVPFLWSLLSLDLLLTGLQGKHEPKCGRFRSLWEISRFL